MANYSRNLNELKRQRLHLMREVDLLNQVISGLEQLSNITGDDDQKAVAASGPGTSEAILTILREGDDSMKDERILTEMERRGWGPRSANPLNALRATLSRLTKEGDISRVDTATYDLPNRAVLNMISQATATGQAVVEAKVAKGVDTNSA